MFGILEQAGICKEVATLAGEVRAPSREENLAHNAGLLQSLGEDSHADELAKLTRADAELGRMTTPMPGMLLIPEQPPPLSAEHMCVSCAAHECDLLALRVHPRFSAVQGIRWEAV